MPRIDTTLRSKKELQSIRIYKADKDTHEGCYIVYANIDEAAKVKDLDSSLYLYCQRNRSFIPQPKKKEKYQTDNLRETLINAPLFSDQQTEQKSSHLSQLKLAREKKALYTSSRLYAEQSYI